MTSRTVAPAELLRLAAKEGRRRIVLLASLFAFPAEDAARFLAKEIDPHVGAERHAGAERWLLPEP